ncbi:unnamed protein product [Mytilus edulis]|uniref:Apple domain-containing protein n=1 Tax=Mytilus edulis TaxID=6550 RepID=A0A8S3UY56_MYTED|nr:unnamed protein product [Mytilus edulis]
MTAPYVGAVDGWNNGPVSQLDRESDVVKHILYSNICNFTGSPYVGAVDGWNNDREMKWSSILYSNICNFTGAPYVGAVDGWNNGLYYKLDRECSGQVYIVFQTFVTFTDHPVGAVMDGIMIGRVMWSSIYCIPTSVTAGAPYVGAVDGWNNAPYVGAVDGWNNGLYYTLDRESDVVKYILYSNICNFTGAPYVGAVDGWNNGLYYTLDRESVVVKYILYSNICNFTGSPYVGAVDGWNNGLYYTLDRESVVVKYILYSNICNFTGAPYVGAVDGWNNGLYYILDRECSGQVYIVFQTSVTYWTPYVGAVDGWNNGLYYTLDRESDVSSIYCIPTFVTFTRSPYVGAVDGWNNDRESDVVKYILYSNICNFTGSPYVGAVDGWNNGLYHRLDRESEVVKYILYSNICNFTGAPYVGAVDGWNNGLYYTLDRESVVVKYILYSNICNFTGSPYVGAVDGWNNAPYVGAVDGWNNGLYHTLDRESEVVKYILYSNICNFTGAPYVGAVDGWNNAPYVGAVDGWNNGLYHKLDRESVVVKYILYSNICNFTGAPYVGAVDGWNNGLYHRLDSECDNVTSGDLTALTSSELLCHIATDCISVSCCAKSEVLKRDFYVAATMDTCSYTLTIQLENLIIEKDLLSYAWGTMEYINLYGVLRVVFDVTHVASMKHFNVDLTIKLCYESASGSCLQEHTIFTNSRLYYPECTEPTVPFYGISFDFWKPVPCTLFSGGLNHANGIEHVENLNSSFKFNFTLDTTPATAYKTTIGLTACYISPGTCEDYQLLTASDLKKMTCPGRRRRRRAVTTEVDVTDMKTGLQILTDRNATEEEKNIYVAACIEYSKNSKDYSITYVGDGDEKSGGKSALKALGSGNPTTVGVSGEVFSGTFTVQGGEEIFNSLDVAVTGIKDAYAIGQGLSEVGAKLLGEKLANMTVGDIETLMDFKNVDPILVAQLMKDLRDLAKALYSEFLSKLLSNGDEVFKSFDFTLKGDFSFPKQDVDLFKYSIHMLVGGILPMQFSFGSGAYYGMKFEIGAKVLEMKAICGVEPYGGVTVYGELAVGFALYGKLRLEGRIMDLRFPTTAEISFNKFPLDVGLVMFLELTPIELNLYALVTLEVDIVVAKFTKTLFKATLWSYKAPIISMKLIDNKKDEEDKTPPDISPFTDGADTNRKKRATPSCEVEQIADRDYVEPMFEIAVRAEDDRSDVAYFLDVGTVPGGKDVMDQHTLGGPKTSVDEASLYNMPTLKDLVLLESPLYFTMYAQNDAGARSMATCSLNTYDVTLPGGRFTEDFLSTSNPAVMKASVVVYEDSDIVMTQVGLGYGKDVWGDQIIPWTSVNVDANAFVPPDLSNDPHNHKVMEMFTDFRVGRLIAPLGGEITLEHSVGDCAKRCADLLNTKCMSFNYDFNDGTCERLEGIEGHHFKLAQYGMFLHYERLGIGHILSFDYNTLWLTHNKTHYFNFRIINDLGFESIISTPGIMLDTTPPETGPINNSTIDYLEFVDCSTKIIPTDRPDFLMWCRGENSAVKNHRVIQDGPESLAVFNGAIFMNDMLYTRANNYISANWDGFNDKQSGLLFISVTVGTEICAETIHEHYDPHSHLFDISQWTHSAMISPLPAPYEQLPDGQYFITVRAINGVKYGGPFATTVCHTTPYIVDNSPPIIYELYNIQYDEFQYNLTYRHNSSDPESGIFYYDCCLALTQRDCYGLVFTYLYVFSDPESGILYNDCCLGLTQRDCYELPWTRLDFTDFVTITVSITAGIPIWVKNKAINNVDLRTIKAADQPIIIDPTPPIAGKVYDGQTSDVDLLFTKEQDVICANWQGFYDPESGISFYMVSIGSEPLENVTDVSNLTQVSRQLHDACVLLQEAAYLEHGRIYYTTVWAFNGAARQLNISGISNGVLVDLTPSVPGQVIDGLLDNFIDLDYTSSQAKVEAQWKDYYDPDSTIKQYDVQVSSAQNMSNDFSVIREWVTFSNDSTSAKWLNFHLAHRDRIKIELKTTNGALNSIVNETDTYVVDLTPPALSYLGDGLTQGGDIDFQSYATSLSTNFKFEDHESGLDYYRIQIYEKYQGSKRQLVPIIKGNWLDLTDDPTRTSYTHSGMSLNLGAAYSIRVGSLNKAGHMAVFETDSVRVDTSPPSVKWLRVGTLISGQEEEVGGYVFQANGIKAAWLAADPESGIIGYEVAVGTTPGGTDKLDWTLYGAENDLYIQGLSLDVTNLTTHKPVYYVSIKAENGAQLFSSSMTSTPIVVVEEDRAGLVVDGADGTDENTPELGVDVDYTVDTTTVTVTV